MATILCVTDDPTIALLFADTLGRMGHTVTPAACVHDALDAARAHSIDLVLAEYQLPDLDGLELLRILRGHGRDVPFIMLTDREAIEEAVQAIEHGAEDCITKPVRVATIEVAVKNALDRAALRRQNAVLLDEVAALRAVASLARPQVAPTVFAPPSIDPDAVVLPNLDVVEAERILISTALERAEGNKTRAALLLNMSLRTLRHKLNAAQVLATAS